MVKATSIKRTRNIFNPSSKDPFTLSRSRLENFIRCPRCFYLDRRLGIDQPPGYPFTLNTAVDHLLKKEFDIHRAEGTTHPLMKAYGIDAIPFQHPRLDSWRENFVGVRYRHDPTNFIITGAVDDIWISSVRGPIPKESADAQRHLASNGVNPKGTLLHVVDYKATSTDGEISLDAEYREGYKRQMEIYQWLLRRNGFMVSNTGYFVYANGKKDRKTFDGKLEFDVMILPYSGNDAWVEQGIIDAHTCLVANAMPEAASDCTFCSYRKAVQEIERF